MQDRQNSPKGVLCVHRMVSSVHNFKEFYSFKKLCAKNDSFMSLLI